MRCADRALLLIAVLLLGGCASFGSAGPSTSPAPSSAGTSAPTQAAKGSGSKASTAAAAPARAPATPEEQFQSALQKMQAHDYAGAEPILVSLTKTNPSLPGPYVNLGIVYARTNRADAAIQALKQALAINGRNAAAQNQLGILLRQAGQLQAASQAYEAALAAAPDYANAHLNLALLYDVYLRQPALALPHYEQYRKLVPSDARVAVWIADLKQRTRSTP